MYKRQAQVIPVWGRRRILVGVSPDAESTVIPLCVPQDVAGWKSGLLIVRVHEVGSMPGDSALEVHVQRVDTSPDDPSVVFTGGPYLATAQAQTVGLTVANLSLIHI